MVNAAAIVREKLAGTKSETIVVRIVSETCESGRDSRRGAIGHVNVVGIQSETTVSGRDCSRRVMGDLYRSASTFSISGSCALVGL